MPNALIIGRGVCDPGAGIALDRASRRGSRGWFRDANLLVSGAGKVLGVIWNGGVLDDSRESDAMKRQTDIFGLSAGSPRARR